MLMPIPFARWSKYFEIYTLINDQLNNTEQVVGGSHLYQYLKKQNILVKK